MIEESKLIPAAGAAWAVLLKSTAQSSGVPWQLVAAEISQESGWNAQAFNAGSGAQGIAQFEPATASSLGVDPWNPYSAIPGMVHYLARLHTLLSTQGYAQWSYTLAAYDWGIGNVENALNNSVPENQWPQETRTYVQNITSASGIDTGTAALFA